MKAKFSLGRTVITRPAQAVLTAEDVQTALRRHAAGDWGDVDEDDRRENERSLNQRLRLLSVYHAANGTKFWVITEADRSSTCVLLPDDY